MVRDTVHSSQDCNPNMEAVASHIHTHERGQTDGEGCELSRGTITRGCTRLMVDEVDCADGPEPVIQSIHTRLRVRAK